MNRRSARRHISPRTKRRYRAIKNFLRRTLGTASQQEIKINSSISVGVADLKQKIDGIEQQLNTVSKHCQDLACLEYNLRAATVSSLSTECQDNLDLRKSTESCTKSLREPETKILYKTSQDRCGKSIFKKSTSKPSLHNDEKSIEMSENTMPDKNYFSQNKAKTRRHYDKLDPIEEYEKTSRGRKYNATLEKSPTTRHRNNDHTNDELRMDRPHPQSRCPEAHHHKRRNKTNYEEISNELLGQSNNFIEQRCGDRKTKSHRNKYLRKELDQDFIADIIDRQYKPVKLLGRRESEFSQFSAPICRDQEFPNREIIQEGSDLCSCCHHEPRRQRHSRYMCTNDLSDMRSICDTRLYSSRKHRRHANSKKRLENTYNDSAMYDVVPVKEKTSPKSRRKFVEDNMLIYDKYREVPPSPRTQRPRLNLRAQNYPEDDEESIQPERHIRKSQQKPLNYGNLSKMSSEVFIHNNNAQRVLNLQIQNTPKPCNEECVGTAISSAQYPFHVVDQTVIHNNDITQNTNTTEVSADKTDRALSEIKGILQNFLQEIKKESSQSEKLNTSVQSNTQNTTEQEQQIRRDSFNNNNSYGQCTLQPFLPPFPNPCCYPILPYCPMNCMQNGFIVPSPSFTCAACANNSKERTSATHDSKNLTGSLEQPSNETQKLIKEIHNLISQNPNAIRKKDYCNATVTKEKFNMEDTKNYSTNSLGNKAKPSKHDANVGTPKMKCHSKSCEAIRSKEASRYDANVSRSDTALEKGSSEETTVEQSSSESDCSSESTVVEQKKGNKFKKMLRSIGILKKNKTDVIEEQSDASLEVEKPRPRTAFQQPRVPPFQQHLMNYNMYGQEYFHPPPTSPHHQFHYNYNGHPPLGDPRTCCSPRYVNNKKFHGRHDERQCTSPHQIAIPPCANYYDPHYGNISPQVPLCLKEIEVKSIGTQSVRKMSLLQKLTNKIQVPQSRQAQELSLKQNAARTFWKDKLLKEKSLIDKPAKNLFDWKNVHEKAMQKTGDPLKFSYNTQQRLAEGDNTMRKAMLKKLFYKRNPFSPRNLLVRTILGKDRSSFGEPPKMYKPSMFV